ncbi:MAG: hypothetical protein AAF992_19000 [Bacteroidota bacterium]
MKKLILLALMVSFSCLESKAQFYDSASVWRPGFYIGFPIQQLDLNDLNRELEVAGIPEISSTLAGFSLGFVNRHRDQNSYGLTQFSYLSTFEDGNDAGSDARLNLWRISFSGQYDVIPSKKWLGYPYLGFGFSLARLRVSSITEVNSFQGSLDNLDSPDELVKRYTSGLLINGQLGAGIERRLTFPGTTSFIGVSAGYEISPSSEWRTGDANYFLANSPSFRTNGLVFEFRLRVEYDPTTLTEKEKQPRGLFKFFQ